MRELEYLLDAASVEFIFPNEKVPTETEVSLTERDIVKLTSRDERHLPKKKKRSFVRPFLPMATCIMRQLGHCSATWEEKEGDGTQLATPVWHDDYGTHDMHQHS